MFVELPRQVLARRRLVPAEGGLPSLSLSGMWAEAGRQPTSQHTKTKTKLHLSPLANDPQVPAQAVTAAAAPTEPATEASGTLETQN